MYQYNDIQAMQRTAENIDEMVAPGTGYGDFYRTGIEIYIGSFPDVSGPDLVIDPHDHKAVELFKEFAGKLAAHYSTLKTQTP